MAKWRRNKRGCWWLPLLRWDSGGLEGDANKKDTLSRRNPNRVYKGDVGLYWTRHHEINHGINTEGQTHKNTTHISTAEDHFKTPSRKKRNFYSDTQTDTQTHRTDRQTECNEDTENAGERATEVTKRFCQLQKTAFLAPNDFKMRARGGHEKGDSVKRRWEHSPSAWEGPRPPTKLAERKEKKWSKVKYGNDSYSNKTLGRKRRWSPLPNTRARWNGWSN